LFEHGKCPKGRRCNYLHVFRNPPLKSIEKNKDEFKRKHKRSKSRERSKKKKKKSHH
ncbi:unnamed protein product, partial [Rotaria sp. Silwood2]